MSQKIVLVMAVLAVGILHTLVPDHWAPIAALARQRGWTPREAGKAAAGAGLGHTISTLILGFMMWIGGVELATHLGRSINLVSSIALILFGAWVALGAWKEMHGHHGAHSNLGHVHLHKHADGSTHTHWHSHHGEDWHSIDGNLALSPSDAPIHLHYHKTSLRTSLMLILGSSPMVEGIPFFFRAAPFGLSQLVIMMVVFSIATIATYVILVSASVAGLQRISLGRFEQYGEVISGLFVAALGVIFIFLPV